MPRAGLDSEAVVTAAAQLADADGLGQLTLAGLAARLGVRTPSLYGHVGGLDDLRARLALRGAQTLASDLSRAVAGRSGTDALRAMADAYRTFALEHHGIYAALQRVPDAGTPAADAAREIVGILTAVLRGYGLEGDEAIHAARILRSALHGFVELDAGGGFGIPVSLDETWERLVTMLDHGLRSMGAGGA
jgi:AcrR family transcriptional regulator